MRFILLFVGAVGLRSAELLSATLGDLRMETEAWVMQVRGKGVKDRIAAVPGQAPPAAPLLASAVDPMAPVGYQALYEHVKGWLRHSFGTRAIARQVPLDVIQAQMGHASIQTTTAIYGRAPIRRRVDELGKAFR